MFSNDHRATVICNTEIACILDLTILGTKKRAPYVDIPHKKRLEETLEVLLKLEQYLQDLQNNV